MPTVYSRPTQRADDDLEFRLKRSIELIQERKANQMATKVAKKKKATVERAAVSRERRLALAVRAILDATDGDNLSAELTDACANANAELDRLGFSNLIGIPRQVTQLTTELNAATAAQDWAKVAELGRQLERVKAGRAVPKSSAVVKKVAKKKVVPAVDNSADEDSNETQQ